MTDSGDACTASFQSVPGERVQYLRSVPDAPFRFAVGASAHIVGQPCLDDVAFLTVDGFCAESGNLDVGVSDAKEFKSVVHDHFKAFFRK